MEGNRRRKKLIEPRLQVRLACYLFLAATGSVLVQVFVLRQSLTQVAGFFHNDKMLLLGHMTSILWTSASITLALLLPLSMTGSWIFGSTAPSFVPMWRVSGCKSWV